MFYDNEALAQPLRLIQVHIKTGELEEVDPFIYARCIQTIFPVDGRPKPLSPGTTIEYTVPDIYGRPWAQIWERYLEDGMQRPADDALFDFSRESRRYGLGSAKTQIVALRTTGKSISGVSIGNVSAWAEP